MPVNPLRTDRILANHRLLPSNDMLGALTNRTPVTGDALPRAARLHAAADHERHSCGELSPPWLSAARHSVSRPDPPAPAAIANYLIPLGNLRLYPAAERPSTSETPKSC